MCASILSMRSYEYVNDPSIMEAMTRESQYLALECGFLEMVLEGDSSNTCANLVSEVGDLLGLEL